MFLASVVQQYLTTLHTNPQNWKLLSRRSFMLKNKHPFSLWCTMHQTIQWLLWPSVSVLHRVSNNLHKCTIDIIPFSSYNLQLLMFLTYTHTSVHLSPMRGCVSICAPMRAHDILPLSKAGNTQHQQLLPGHRWRGCWLRQPPAPLWFRGFGLNASLSLCVCVYVVSAH